MAGGTIEEMKSAASTLIRERRYEEALSLLESVSNAGPDQLQDLLEMQAVCYFRTRQFEQACACFQQLADENPTSAKPLVNLGAVYNRLKKYSEAVAALRKALQRDRQNFDAYYNLGFAHRNAGNPDLAIPAYKEAIKLNPKFDQAHLNLANAYVDINNNRMAILHFQTALSINPDLEAAQRGLKKAQDRENQEVTEDNPFGRLVDITKLSHQKNAGSMKILNEVERKKDRDDVQRAVKSIRNVARQVSEDIRDKMEPTLLRLTRALIDGENRPDLVASHHEDFHNMITQFEVGRRHLKRSVLELRGHEELMNTPDVDV